MPSALTLANIPQDDAALNALLDGLEAPTGTDSTSFSVPDIPLAISTANSLLADLSTVDTIPILADDGANAASVTASALTAVVRLARSVSANASLRRTAENRTLETEARVTKLESDLKTTAQKMRARDTTVATLERRVADAGTREKQLRRAAETEKCELRTKIAKLNNRETLLLQEKRKREREFAKLQKRVHAQLASARKINMQPVVTLATQYVNDTAERHHAHSGEQGEEEEEETYVQFMNCAYQRRIDELDAENDEFRTLVRAVHEELDALMETFPQIVEVESEQQRLIEGEDAQFRPPGEAPSREIMDLPYPVVRDAVEDSLVAKFKMLRRALLDAEEGGGRNGEEEGIRVDEGESGDVQSRRTGETVPQGDDNTGNGAEVDNVQGNVERENEAIGDGISAVEVPCAAVGSMDTEGCGEIVDSVVAVASIAEGRDANAEEAAVDAVVEETDAQQSEDDASVGAASVKRNESECEPKQTDMEAGEDETLLCEANVDKEV